MKSQPIYQPGTRREDDCSDPKKVCASRLKEQTGDLEKNRHPYQFLHFLHAVIPYTMKSREYLNHFTHEDLSHHVD